MNHQNLCVSSLGFHLVKLCTLTQEMFALVPDVLPSFGLGPPKEKNLFAIVEQTLQFECSIC